MSCALAADRTGWRWLDEIGDMGDAALEMMGAVYHGVFPLDENESSSRLCNQLCTAASPLDCSCCRAAGS